MVRADLVLHGNLANVFSGDILEAYVGIKDDLIIYVGKTTV